MSSPIVPIPGLTGSTRLILSTGNNVPVGADAFRAELSAGSRELDAAAGEGGPPSEVMHQIDGAGRISRQLDESGYEVRFSESSEGRVTVELIDHEGNTLRTMKVSEALEIAAGKPLN